MTLTSGIEAIDYSSIVTKGHLQPIDLAATKVKDQIDQTKKVKIRYVATFLIFKMNVFRRYLWN